MVINKAMNHHFSYEKSGHESPEPFKSSLSEFFEDATQQRAGRCRRCGGHLCLPSHPRSWCLRVVFTRWERRISTWWDGVILGWELLCIDSFLWDLKNPIYPRNLIHFWEVNSELVVIQESHCKEQRFPITELYTVGKLGTATWMVMSIHHVNPCLFLSLGHC